MRSAKGIQLVEMVVAVSLSGVFVVLLSGMLAQTLALSSASQNQIVASAIADQVVEQIQHHGYLCGQGDVGMSSTVGPLDSSLQINPSLQLDLSTNSYGTYKQGGTFDQSLRWTDTSGNWFRGNLLIEPFPERGTTSDTTYTVTVSFPSENGSMKSIKRTTTFMPNGALY